jgi:hypothetical protein
VSVPGIRRNRGLTGLRSSAEARFALDASAAQRGGPIAGGPFRNDAFVAEQLHCIIPHEPLL